MYNWKQPSKIQIQIYESNTAKRTLTKHINYKVFVMGLFTVYALEPQDIHYRVSDVELVLVREFLKPKRVKFRRISR